MIKQEEAVLLDFKAYIDKCIFEDSFEQCLSAIAHDVNEVLVNGTNSNSRITQGEHGRIILPGARI